VTVPRTPREVRDSPVQVGGRVLVDYVLTGVAGLTWVTAETVDQHRDPGDLPWNDGPAFPFRIGYRLDADPPRRPEARGVLWLAADATAASGAVRSIDHS
jgi:hypothetical protein